MHSIRPPGLHSPTTTTECPWAHSDATKGAWAPISTIRPRVWQSLDVSLRRQAARGVFWTAAGNWGYQLATLVVFAMLSRLLTPEAFGLVALASVFVIVLKLVGEQGMADAVVQREDLEPEHLDTAFWISVGMASVLSAVLILVSGILAELVNEPDLAPILAWMSLALFLAGFSNVQRAILSRELRFASITARTLSSVVAGGIVGVGAALAGFGVWSLVAQLITMELVGVVALWSASDWRPSLRFSRKHFRELFTFGSSVLGFKLLRFSERHVDNLMVGSLLSATALGFYVVAYRLLNLIINVTTSVIGNVAFPVFSRIQDDAEQVRRAYYKAVRLTGILSFPAFAGLIVLAPEATRLAFGPQWDASVPVMRVLAVAGLAQSVLFVNGVVLKSLGKPGWRLAIMTVSVLLLVGGFAVAVQWGIVAVAVTVVVVTYALAPVWLMATNRLIGLGGRRYLSQVGPPLLASIAMSLVVMGLKLGIEPWPLVWSVPTLVIVGIVTYGALLWVFARPMAVEALNLARLSIPRRGEDSGEG